MSIDGKIIGNFNYIANIINEQTGEVEQWALTKIRKKGIQEGFFMAIQEGFIFIATLGLQGRELQVLLYIMGKLDFENYINLSQKDISEALKMQKQHVSKAFKTLEKHNIIHKGPKVGQSWTYRLDPNFGYKGRTKNLEKLQKTLDKAKKAGFEVIEGAKNE